MKITIVGDLSKEEAFEILLKVRNLDKRDPKRHISVVVDARETEHEEMKGLLDAVFGGDPHESFTYTRKEEGGGD